MSISVSTEFVIKCIVNKWVIWNLHNIQSYYHYSYKQKYVHSKAISVNNCIFPELKISYSNFSGNGREITQNIQTLKLKQQKRI